MFVPYHHGNLRQTLIDTALGLIAKHGPVGFTLREVARTAGVSHNAPYRHFESRDHLLAAVATEGFHALRDATRQAMATRRTARTRLEACGLAYVAFALDRPHHFAAMFDVTLDAAVDPACATAADEAFGVLLDAVADAQADGLMRGHDTMTTALRAWSLVHGVSRLAVAGRLPFSDREAVMAFARGALHADRG